MQRTKGKGCGLLDQPSTPTLLKFGAIKLCCCVTARNACWKGATAALQRRLESLGLGSHVTKRGRWGQQFLGDPENTTPKGNAARMHLQVQILGATARMCQKCQNQRHPVQCLCSSISALCAPKFAHTRESLFAHYDAAHRPQNNAPCQTCTVTCQECGKRTKPKGLSQHYLSHHSRVLTQKRCCVCFELFKTTVKRDEHMRSAHP